MYISELRKATIPIFFDMMQCEFMQLDPTTRKIKANFKSVSTFTFYYYGTK